MKVAFLGLGNMGAHMARHFLRAQHDVTVWNRTASKAEGLRAEGAKLAKSAGEAAHSADVVITMLADDHAVELAVLHSGGVLENLSKGGLHISMSTISVALSRKLAEQHAARGQQYVAAPVFGRPEAAEARKLFIAAAGESAAVERAKPLLETLGQRVFVMGDRPEMANVVKLSGNFLIASVIESLGEAIALTRKYGIDPHAYVEFLTNSLFAAPIYKTYGNLIADEKYQPAGFKLRLGLKDIRLALAAGEAVDAPLPFASVMRDHILTAIARGMEDWDWSSTAKLAAENAGLK
ncbi:MAG: NAD(P)-dependent oxidoreductase [Acidobacteriota bacterium]|nr:NAD(P)-dependent oxidoreductase [Acidobacteriota bacterium]